MFKVGQKVVCVNDTINPETLPYMPLRPKLHAVYTVADRSRPCVGYATSC